MIKKTNCVTEGNMKEACTTGEDGENQGDSAVGPAVDKEGAAPRDHNHKVREVSEKGDDVSSEGGSPILEQEQGQEGTDAGGGRGSDPSREASSEASREDNWEALGKFTDETDPSNFRCGMPSALWRRLNSNAVELAPQFSTPVGNSRQKLL